MRATSSENDVLITRRRLA